METRDDRDVELARALIAGRMEAFDEFVETFRTRIYQYSYQMCGMREDAEEVAQDTLLKVFENFASLREPERIRAWVFRIAKNACLMKRRRSIFAPDHEVSLDGFSDEPGHPQRQLPSAGDAPDDEAYKRQMSEALHKAIQTLHPNYRAIILLRDIEELSTEDAAEVLDLSIDVVKQRLHRARVALRKALDEQLQAPDVEVALSGKS